MWNRLSMLLSCGWTPARPQLPTSIFTHSDRIFLDLPRPLMPGMGKSVTDLIQDKACSTCPYHMSHWLWRTAVISSMPSFCRRTAEVVVSSQSFVPQIQWIMAQSLQRSRCTMNFQWKKKVPWNGAVSLRCPAGSCETGPICINLRHDWGDPADMHANVLGIMITCKFPLA